VADADIYEDVSSGAKASRPALNRLIADARAKFVCLLVWNLDRFGRSLVDCLNNIKILEENGIRFIAVTKDWIRISRIRRAVSVARAGCRSRV
jgi:DNA invertase Pin-like site-specific DNA recombinase